MLIEPPEGEGALRDPYLDVLNNGNLWLIFVAYYFILQLEIFQHFVAVLDLSFLNYFF